MPRDIPVGNGKLLIAFDKDYRIRDIEFISPLYKPLIKAAGDFMVSYRAPETGLPLPSYDLWEERQGVLTWTTAAVWAGLMAAANFTDCFGETEISQKYREAAREIKTGMLRHLYDEERSCFFRMIRRKEDGSWRKDSAVDASLFAVFYFDLFAPDDPRVIGTMETIRDNLWCQTEVGGIARYSGDNYQQIASEGPKVSGNPWFICTMWLAQWEIARAESVDALKSVHGFLKWVTEHALPSGILAEQVNPYTNDPISVSPLTWSHATFVAVVQEYLNRLEELSACPVCGHPTFLKSPLTPNPSPGGRGGWRRDTFSGESLSPWREGVTRY